MIILKVLPHLIGTDGKTVFLERVSTRTIFHSQLSSNDLRTHPAPPLQKVVAVRVNSLPTAASLYPKLYNSTVKTMEATVLKSEPSGAGQKLHISPQKAEPHTRFRKTWIALSMSKPMSLLGIEELHFEYPFLPLTLQ